MALGPVLGNIHAFVSSAVTYKKATPAYVFLIPNCSQHDLRNSYWNLT